jgi:hypothetical protein
MDKDNDNEKEKEQSQQNDIHIMKNIKLMMDKDICLQSGNEDYKQIYKLSCDYLKKHCKHNIIKIMSINHVMVVTLKTSILVTLNINFNL